MNDTLQLILEVLAVLLAVTYLLLAARQSILCWYAAGVSSVLFLAVFWQVGLVMETGLQIYYIAMAFYGWHCWRMPRSSGSAQIRPKLAIRVWPLHRHLLLFIFLILASWLVGWALDSWTQAKLPYLDAWTSLASVLATWMVARKILENWLYWILIDSVSIYLYLDRELYVTVGLFVVYIVIACGGWYSWLATHRENQSSARVKT